MKSLDAESRYLRELRDTLLPQLMSGEVKVREPEELVEDAT
jgi:type I restriction enzyme S subunit